MVNIELFGSQYGFEALLFNAVAGYFSPFLALYSGVGET